MIDMLVLRCPIRSDIKVSYKPNGVPLMTDTTDFLKLEELEIPLEGSINTDKTVSNLRHAWESIPSSLSTLAFKVFDFRDNKDGSLFVEIKASPAKLMLGHNVFGSDDLKECSLSLLNLLYMTYPTLSGYLHHESWYVASMDITYHSKCRNQNEAIQFINALQNVSSGQTKSRTGYSGTAYFGKKNSRLKKLKVYDKLKEVLAYIDKNSKKNPQIMDIFTNQLLQFCNGMVRWESSITMRWLSRRGLPSNLIQLSKQFNPRQLWKESTLDIFKALEGKEMRIIKDDKIKNDLRKIFPTINTKTGNITYSKADSAYRTYRAIKADGFSEVKQSMTSSTFYRHIEMLQEIGFSKILLQNLAGEGIHNEVIPMVRYCDVVFSDQIPDFAPAYLRLVA